MLLFAVVAVVFLIACANLAGLLLARGAARYRETAIRAALGAGRKRLVQHFLVESFLLACCGTLLALVLNIALTETLNRATFPTPIPVLFHIRPDAGLLAAGFVLALAATLLGGLGPALHAAKPRLSLALKQEEPRFETSRVTLRKALVAGQVAVSFILLVTALLFLRNMRLATETRPGFDVEPVSWAEVLFLPGRDATDSQARLVEPVLSALRAIPGVEAAACVGSVPLSHNAMARSGSVSSVNIPSLQSKLLVSRSFNYVSPQYFRTMGIPLVEGREFDDRDTAGSQEPLIVNQTFVDRYLEGRSALGRTVTEETRGGKTTWTIVGVVANSKYGTLGEQPMAAFYTPFPQRALSVNFLVRTDRPAAEMLRAIDHAIRKQDPLAAVDVKTMRQGLTFAFLPSQVGLVMLGSFGLLGLFLAMVGLYGMLAYTVSRRTSEIGIRMALGATQGEVVRMALRESLGVVGVGMAVGLALSLIVTKPLAAFLVPVLSPHDPLSLLGTTALLMAAAFAASLVPARRAARIDPMEALRHE